MGANTAPLTQSWWGAKGGSDSVAVGAPPIPAAGLSSRVTSVSDTSRTDDPALARARLQADRAEMEEKLKRLKEEEDNLARKEAENKQREEETKRRDADQRRKNDELERQRADRDNARRRELDSRPPQSMYPPRPPHDRPMPPDLPPRDGPMRPGLVSSFAIPQLTLTPASLPMSAAMAIVPSLHLLACVRPSVPDLAMDHLDLETDRLLAADRCLPDACSLSLHHALVVHILRSAVPHRVEMATHINQVHQVRMTVTLLEIWWRGWIGVCPLAL